GGTSPEAAVIKASADHRRMAQRPIVVAVVEARAGRAASVMAMWASRGVLGWEGAPGFEDRRAESQRPLPYPPAFAGEGASAPRRATARGRHRRYEAQRSGAGL